MFSSDMLNKVKLQHFHERVALSQTNVFFYQGLRGTVERHTKIYA